MRKNRLSRLWAALALVLLTVVPSFAATLSGTVINNSTKPTGRVYVSLEGWPTGAGVSIAAPGTFSVRGVEDGSYNLRAFMDSNNDGAFSMTEASAQSAISISGGVVVSGSTTLAMYAPQYPLPLPPASPAVHPGNNLVMVSWEYPHGENGGIAADSFSVEYSSNGFATFTTVAAGPLLDSNGDDEGNRVISGLTNGVTYSFRVRSKIGTDSAVSEPTAVLVGTPAGGNTVSGTVTFNGFTTSGKPLYVALWSDMDEKFYVVRYATPTSGMSFTIPGVQSGARHIFAFVDENANGALDFGDYFVSQTIPVDTKGANVTGLSVPISGSEINILGVNAHHNVLDGGYHYYFLWLDVDQFRKRPVNISVTGPQMLTRDVDALGGELSATVPVRPNAGDTYSFTITFADGSTKIFSGQIKTVYDTPPSSVSPTGTITSSPTQVNWQAPVGFPTGGYAYASIWGEDNDVSWESGEYPTNAASIAYDGPALQNGQYRLILEVCDPYWNCVARDTAFSVVLPSAVPASISVPASDPDGTYTVSWGASATPGATYVLEEATNSGFTSATAINAGIGRSVTRTGRAPATAYYYRVKATATGYSPSAWRTAAAPCNVSPAVPATLTVPASDLDGAYTVSWSASAGTGVGYTLQEATDASFTTGVRTAYTGTAISAAIVGRTIGTTYYYRVKADKSGFVSSAYRTAANGCLTGSVPAAAVPATITVPVSDADGAYAVSWGASATAGVSYELQEATNATFTTGLRTISAGTALSAAVTGRLLNLTYYYRVRAVKSGYTASAYRTALNGCAVPGGAAAAPASITVPAADLDGAYAVSWTASATAGVSYELQEATNATFTTGLRTINAGTALSAAVTGRLLDVTYYYRVRAVKPGMVNSAYRTAASGCAVPGTSTVYAPGSVTVPVADTDGAYVVSWTASATAGAIYQLQEATNATFTAGLRTVSSGAALSSAITARPLNVTYYYRVAATKPGMLNSTYRVGGNGCAVPGGTVAAPASITVPVADVDGSYSVSWGASATVGAVYQLQEATDPAFTVGVRTAYSGSDLSTAITGRSLNLNYYYRVIATKPGMLNSAYKTALNGCAVPGTYTAATPGTLVVPAKDADGSFTVSWGASATLGVTYLLQEATNSSFTTGVRTAYSGTGLSTSVTGRTPNLTYYYRVLAMKPGMVTSVYRVGANGCLIAHALYRTAWFAGSTDPAAHDAVVLVFLDNGRYMMAQNGVADTFGHSGIEHGTYSYNSATGAVSFTTPVDTNGEWGFSHIGTGVTASVSATVLTFTVPSEGTFTFTKLANNATYPAIGTWVTGNPDPAAQDASTLIFLTSNRYILIDDGGAPSDGGQSGMEHGTYVWNQSTGIFTVTAVVDTDGAWGISNFAAGTTLAVSGSTATMTVPGDGTYTATRLY